MLLLPFISIGYRETTKLGGTFYFDPLRFMLFGTTIRLKVKNDRIGLKLS